MYVLSTNGDEINFEATVMVMDDDLREEIHRDLTPCGAQEFYDVYCARHYKKFAEEFTI